MKKRRNGMNTNLIGVRGWELGIRVFLANPQSRVPNPGIRIKGIIIRICRKSIHSKA
jgi:hypothetical protein